MHIIVCDRTTTKKPPAPSFSLSPLSFFYITISFFYFLFTFFLSFYFPLSLFIIYHSFYLLSFLILCLSSFISLTQYHKLSVHRDCSCRASACFSSDIAEKYNSLETLGTFFSELQFQPVQKAKNL
jgi:hypothetical protein